MFNLKELRISKGYTVSQVAEICNCSVSTIINVEQDQNYISNMNVDTILYLAEVFSIEPESLFDIEKLKKEVNKIIEEYNSKNPIDSGVNKVYLKNTSKISKWIDRENISKEESVVLRKKLSILMSEYKYLDEKYDEEKMREYILKCNMCMKDIYKREFSGGSMLKLYKFLYSYNIKLLVDIAEVNNNTLYNYMNGFRKLDKANALVVVRLALAFNLSINELING